MNILVAMDSFKGSLTSLEAGRAVAEGIRRAVPGWQVSISPLADGGEGTVEALTEGLGGQLLHCTVRDPLGRPIDAVYGVIDDTAVIEMSSAAGLALLTENERDPMKTSTYGVGELIKDAISQGCRRFIIGIGGSATNDCGTGCLSALGFRFLDGDGQPVKPCAHGLRDIASVSVDQALPELKYCEFSVACDVTNPLYGSLGCSQVFSRQKGAKEADIPLMDQWIKVFSAIVKETLPEADPELPGSGAAGGLGFGLRTFLNARLIPGAQLIIEKTGLEEKILHSDLVVTGEGCIDAQTAMGKAPIAVAELARKHDKPCIGFGGIIGEGAEACLQKGMTAFFPAIRRLTSLDDAMDRDNAIASLSQSAEQTFRLLGHYI